MSKSLGNSPDPLDLIASHGADSVRLGMLLCAPAGNDILFDESQIEQGRNFCNKIWNAFRLIKSWEGEAIELRSYERETIEWFTNRMALVIGENEAHFKEFRLSNALMNLYKLVWDDFCSTYLEGVKPAYGSKISKEALLASQQFMDTLMKAIHPIMPFISEEIHQGLALDYRACVVSEYPNFKTSQKGDLDIVLNAITELRGVRAQHQISPKIQFNVWLRNPLNEIETYKEMIGKLANVSWQDGEMAEGNFVMIPLKNMEMWVELEIEINKEEEIAKIEKEIAHLEGFLTGIMKKLGNEKFMNNANQDVIDRELQKKADAESKIQNLLHQKSQLS
jgi:valyl-tRNA synthetase